VGGAAAGGQDDDVDAQRKIIINPKSKSPKKNQVQKHQTATSSQTKH